MEHATKSNYLVSPEDPPSEPADPGMMRPTFYGAVQLATSRAQRLKQTHHIFQKTPTGWLSVGRIER